MSEPTEDNHPQSEDRSREKPAAANVAGVERDDQLADLVDDLEDEVTEQRRAAGIPGNARDRSRTPPIDTGDEAPD